MIRILPLLVVVLAACGPQVVPPRDVRIAIPEADASMIDFVTAEHVIEPGQEKMFCSELSYDGPDTAFSTVESLQGKFGHHVVLVSTKAPHGPGSVYDCTDMTDFVPLAIPAGDLPAGYGSRLTNGTPIVIQMHYINSGTVPILVRDVVRLRKVEPSTITTWVAPFTFFNDAFSVPAGMASSASFDCVLPAETKVMLIGGHMHEWGTSFKLESGPSAASLTTLYEVPAWEAHYRDDPPVDLYLTNHKTLAAGTVMRVTCSWNNDTSSALAMPKEMCVLFGLVAGRTETLSCRNGSF